jgi:bisphosphoglycerate-independent phosphoglycerate mutase (AlkP superfamily)
MKVRELIEKLEKVQNKEIKVVLRIFEEDVEYHIGVAEALIDKVELNDKPVELNFSIVGSC